MDRIILPAIAAMRQQGRPFKGVLYAGLMLTEAGPSLLEFNARFGDPEAQVLMMRLMSDPLPALIAAHDGILRQVDLRWHADAALCVVMAAKGYPDEPERGSEIRGLGPGRRRSRRQDLPCRHPPRRRADRRRWRPRARRHRTGTRPRPGARPRLRCDRPHRLAARLLPPRHRPPPPQLKTSR